jgi:hypothetical protein
MLKLKFQVNILLEFNFSSSFSKTKVYVQYMCFALVA